MLKILKEQRKEIEQIREDYKKDSKNLYELYDKALNNCKTIKEEVNKLSRD